MMGSVSNGLVTDTRWKCISLKTKLEILVSNLGPKRTTSTTAIGPRLLDTSQTETALGERFQI